MHVRCRSVFELAEWFLPLQHRQADASSRTAPCQGCTMSASLQTPIEWRDVLIVRLDFGWSKLPGVPKAFQLDGSKCHLYRYCITAVFALSYCIACHHCSVEHRPSDRPSRWVDVDQQLPKPASPASAIYCLNYLGWMLRYVLAVSAVARISQSTPGSAFTPMTLCGSFFLHGSAKLASS